MTSRLEVLVTGRVQGVGFRWHALRRALECGLTGAVRNLPDGSVQIVAEGDREALEILLAWAESGPPHGRVTGTQVRWFEGRGEFADFRITG